MSTFPTDLGGAAQEYQRRKLRTSKLKALSNDPCELSAHQMAPARVVRAPRSSTVVSHQMSQGSSAQTLTPTRGPPRLRGPSIAYGCYSARPLHQCAHHYGERAVAERVLVLCLFSSMADTSDRGSAIPSTGTPFFRR